MGRTSVVVIAAALVVGLASYERSRPAAATTDTKSTTKSTQPPKVIHDYPHIAATTTFEEIVNHPAFAGFGPYMDLQESGTGVAITRNIPVEVIGSVRRGWDTQTMLDGLNFMIDQVNRGDQIWYPLYTAKQIAKDPTKATAGMFFVRGDPHKPLAVIVPGGGLGAVVSIQEGFPHALALHRLGFNVAIVKYRIEPDRPPNEDFDARMARAVDDLAQTLRLVKKNADTWKVDLDSYSIWGSSAGGGIASAWGADGPLGAKAHGFKKPAAILAAYPAPWFEPSRTFPPYFVIIAADDKLIPIAEVDAKVDDLRSKGVDVEYQRLESGVHGFGIGVDSTAEGWVDDAVAFWRSHMDKS